MNSRIQRPASSRPPAAPVHRGPQAMTPVAPYGSPTYLHAPNAALLIDFDNVTTGIREDLGKELRNLLSSDIIKGKVAVQRAYADWRRYPNYIVPLAESSIDMIMAPAYGSSKKNATDIRLAVDAIELVFTRPEIGTYILLSGDSDFASLVIKLKEYGKYVIGVGIRESSSDLLVMNCDEYYSYNALAGLVKAGEEEHVPRDPWQLVVEAVARMKRNGDVMRSDRLKQVMQEIDDSFDEKNLGMAKFSRFCQEAAHRGLITLTRLDNGQMEVGVAEGERAAPPARAAVPAPEADRENGTEEGARRSRRGRGGRGRRDGARAPGARGGEPARAERGAERESTASFAPPLAEPVSAPASHALPAEQFGERLTRDEALDLVRRAVLTLTTSQDEPVPANEVRAKARELLGRDSESLNERFFHRILRDAHDADLIDLRKRGDDYEVAPASAPSSSEPLARPHAVSTEADAEPSQAARSAANAAALRRGIRQRGLRGGRTAELPPELLSLGVVNTSPPPSPASEVTRLPLPEPTMDEMAEEMTDVGPESRTESAAAPPTAAPKPRRGARGARGGRTRAPRAPKGEAATAAPAAATPAEDGAAPVPKPRRPRARKKTAASTGSGE